MNRSSLTNSNAMFLSLGEWIVTLALAALISAVICYGWRSWEIFSPGPDYRETCWAERMTDYWAHSRWSACAAQSGYTVFLIGDSVIWGQEVSNGQTISHYLNYRHGKEIFANLGVDALYPAAFPGLFTSYEKSYPNVILHFNPHWVEEVNSDLRGGRKRFYHPRLVSRFDPAIHYNDYTLEERLTYTVENHLGVFSLVHHVLANYYGNKSISAWMHDNPYANPFAAITFQAAPIMAGPQGKGISWEKKKQKIANFPFVSLRESIHWKYFLKSIDILQKRDIPCFVLIGPFNTYMLSPESRVKLSGLVADTKKRLDSRRIPYFDATSGFLPSETFADACHLLAEGHELLAQRLMEDRSFQNWLADIRER